MKIKRLTFTKRFIVLACILIPQIILYFKTPSDVIEEGKIVYAILAIGCWQFGKFVGTSLIQDP